MRYLCKRSDGVFVVLRTNDIPKGIIKKRKHKKLIENSCATSVSTEKGLPFYVLDIPACPTCSQWEKIAENRAPALEKRSRKR
jgi:hypothetical protein